ncbi:hypothetical protein B6U84_06270 [Candidatus Bathyarchaeota archaeon ex4484_40]|nr:MAG: hypothetical protein B6U84_06270 [Candidatus Bathyarchaeota archaeon ex4484_40]
MERSAVILAGGSSSRFGREKALVRLAGKPLICHVFEKVADIVLRTHPASTRCCSPATRLSSQRRYFSS